jgi:hypothetical protein
VVAGRVFFLILVAAYEATAYYPGASANEGAFTPTEQTAYYGATGTTHGRAFGFAAPALGLILGLGYRASQQKEGQQKRKDFRERFHIDTKRLERQTAGEPTGF